MASLLPYNGTLGKRLAAHLLRRATYGATPEEINAFAAKTAAQAVQDLMVFPTAPPPLPIDPQTGATWVINGRTAANSPSNDLKNVVISWWLHQFMDPGAPLSVYHRIVFFLHTCFNTRHNIVTFSEDLYYTLRLFIYYANGSYRDLAYKMCLDNGMNNFLDIGDSLAGNPNENYSREFMELFTIGKGPQIGPGDYTNYTEDDVRAAARLITGFRQNSDWGNTNYHDPETGFPQARLDISRHDQTNKTFSSAFQNQVINGQGTTAGMLTELSDFVDMIFVQDATAKNIVKRLYRHFVKYHITPEADQDIITPLANTLKNNGYNIVPILTTLLASEHFYDADDTDATDETIGSLIKSPLELKTQLCKFFKLPVPDPAIDPFMTYVTFYKWGIQDPIREAFMDLFKSDETAGYPPIYQAPQYNRLWFHQTSVAPRYSMIDDHLSGPAHLQFDLLTWVSDPNIIPDYLGVDPQGMPGPHAGPRIAVHLLQNLLDYLLPEALPQTRFDYFLNDILLDNLSPTNWMLEWDYYLTSGDESSVKPQIQKIIRALVQSPEFQLA